MGAMDRRPHGQERADALGLMYEAHATAAIQVEVLVMGDEELLAAHLDLAELLVRDKENFHVTVKLLQLVVQERSRRRPYRIVVVS